MAIKLIIDSAADLPSAFIREKDITRLPMTVTFGKDAYQDGVDISPREFYEKLIETDELPVTSQIPPYDFEKEFERIIAQGDTPVAITLSSELSGTYQSACIAADSFDGKAHVVDSLNVSLGEAILVEYACRLIESGISSGELVDELNRCKTRIQLLALLDTLEYLKKGGRISAAAAFAGGLLSINPVICIEDGKVKVMGKARGSKHGNNLLIEYISKSGGVDFSMPFTLAYSGLDDNMLQKYISDSRAIWEGHTNRLPILEIGATIGTHAGPGAIGVAFFKNA